MSGHLASPYDAPRDELVRFVPSSARRVLDVGCGTGGYAQELRRARPEVEVWGVEPDPDRARTARPHVVQLVEGCFPDVEGDLAGVQFDAVTFNDVLEHMVRPSAALAGAARLLAAGGVVIASVPNVRHRSVLWPLLVRDRWDYDVHGLLDHTHLRFFTRSTLREFFEACGWTVVKVEGINARWHWREQSERRRTRWLRRVLGERADSWLCMQFVVHAQPPSVPAEAHAHPWL